VKTDKKEVKVEGIITLQRRTKPSWATVAKAIREETGWDGVIQIIAHRRVPVKYEYPYWQFKYSLRDLLENIRANGEAIDKSS